MISYTKDTVKDLVNSIVLNDTITELISAYNINKATDTTDFTNQCVTLIKDTIPDFVSVLSVKYTRENIFYLELLIPYNKEYHSLIMYYIKDTNKWEYKIF